MTRHPLVIYRGRTWLAARAARAGYLAGRGVPVEQSCQELVCSPRSLRHVFTRWHIQPLGAIPPPTRDEACRRSRGPMPDAPATRLVEIVLSEGLIGAVLDE
jgi:hypothetical protein